MKTAAAGDDDGSANRRAGNALPGKWEPGFPLASYHFNIIENRN